MSARQAIAFIQLGIPGRRAVGNKIGSECDRFTAQGAAHDLFHFALMQIDAWTKHAGNLRFSAPSSKPKLRVPEKVGRVRPGAPLGGETELCENGRWLAFAAH